jgi:hypothetical protein
MEGRESGERRIRKEAAELCSEGAEALVVVVVVVARLDLVFLRVACFASLSLAACRP